MSLSDLIDFLLRPFRMLQELWGLWQDLGDMKLWSFDGAI